MPRSAGSRLALLALLAGGPLGCRAKPDILLTPIDVVAGVEEGSGLPDSLRREVACRLEGQGLRVRLLGDGDLRRPSERAPEALGRRIGALWVLSATLLEDQASLRVVLHLTEVADDRGTWVKALYGSPGHLTALADTVANEVGHRLHAVVRRPGAGQASPCAST